MLTPEPVAGAMVPSDPTSTIPPSIADDTLVFVREDRGFRLAGGEGRGAGWADIVEALEGEEPLIDRAWTSGTPVRIRRTAPVRIVGPYWSADVAIVRVGQAHLVVLGGLSDPALPHAALMRAAAHAVARTHGPSADKLLADELELVHALRTLMAYRPETVADTARHIAEVAARSLSCDLGAIRVLRDGEPVMEFVSVDGPADGDGTLAGCDAATYLDAACALEEPLLEQSVDEMPRVWTDPVVSRLTLPLGDRPAVGALSLGHGPDRPRGFTLLCQRIARAIAESAELLLSQAQAREQLDRERELLRRLSMTDPLTGLGNRTAWEAALGMAVARQRIDGSPYAVLSVDLDGLKAVNDHAGHSAGDALLRRAAELLRTSTRTGDLVARTGGDEFLILLAGDVCTAQRVAKRIRRHERAWGSSGSGPAPSLSLGWAVLEGDPAAAIAQADSRMYLAKRRRTRRRSAPEQRHEGIR